MGLSQLRQRRGFEPAEARRGFESAGLPAAGTLSKEQRPHVSRGLVLSEVSGSMAVVIFSSRVLIHQP